MCFSQVDWGCRMQRLHLCRSVRLSNECPEFDIKPSDSEAPISEALGKSNSEL